MCVLYANVLLYVILAFVCVFVMHIHLVAMYICSIFINI